MTTIEQAIAISIAEMSRPPSTYEKALVAARDQVDAQQKAEAFATLVRGEPIGPAFAALRPLTLAD